MTTSAVDYRNVPFHSYPAALDDCMAAYASVSGTQDFVLSDTVRMHRHIVEAGRPADLHIFEGALHGMFGGYAPEDHALVAQVKKILASAWSAPTQ